MIDIENITNEEFRPMVKEFLKDNLHNKTIKDFQTFSRKMYSSICDYLFENAEELDLHEDYMKSFQDKYIDVDSFIGLVAIGSPCSEIDFGGHDESPEMELMEDELDKVYSRIIKKINLALTKVVYI